MSQAFDVNIFKMTTLTPSPFMIYRENHQGFSYLSQTTPSYELQAKEWSDWNSEGEEKWVERHQVPETDRNWETQMSCGTERCGGKRSSRMWWVPKYSQSKTLYPMG